MEVDKGRMKQTRKRCQGTHTHTHTHTRTHARTHMHTHTHTHAHTHAHTHGTHTHTKAGCNGIHAREEAKDVAVRKAELRVIDDKVKVLVVTRVKQAATASTRVKRRNKKKIKHNTVRTSLFPFLLLLLPSLPSFLPPPPCFVVLPPQPQTRTCMRCA